MSFGRKDVINYFVDKNNYESYLEIGLRGAHSTFDHIKCKIKNSVDINPSAKAQFCMSSDEFFEDLDDNLLTIPSDYKWDIIFIDGDHYHETVDRDILNALNHLSDSGTIVMHDCAYGEGITAANPRGTSVWKSWVKLRCTRPDLTMNVVDFDWGVGIIQRGSQSVWEKESLEKCLTEEYFTSLVDENLENPLDTYIGLKSDGCFVTAKGCIYSNHHNLTRTKLLPLITKEEFYTIYE